MTEEDAYPVLNTPEGGLNQSFEEKAIEISIVESYAGQRVDKVLAELLHDYSRSRIQSIIKGKSMTLNGKICKTGSTKVEAGDDILIIIPAATDPEPKPENIPLDIVYEDDDVIVLNKAAGMVVHPAVGNQTGTLVNALLHHCGDTLSGIGGVKRPGIVHRLDKETSGLMVVAKNDNAHHSLSDQLKDRTLSRMYKVFVWKQPTLKKGYVEAPIGRHRTNRLKMAVMMTSGRDAKTFYTVEEKFKTASSMMHCKLDSGRTHQIRVHMQHIKHPGIGDALYGLMEQEQRALLKRDGYEEEAIEYIVNFPRQALHAYEIGFVHPATGNEMQFSAVMPEDMQILENHLKSVP